MPSLRTPDEVSGPRSASLISGTVELRSSIVRSTPGTSVTNTRSEAPMPAASAAAAVSAFTFISMPDASAQME